jgi:leucyl aminopeptidase
MDVIMNFKLVSMDWLKAAQTRSDALIVIHVGAPSPAKAGSTGAIQGFITKAFKAEVLNSKAIGVLASFQVEGIAAQTVVLAQTPDRSLEQIRKVVGQAMASVKSAKAKRLVVCLADLGDQAHTAAGIVVQAIAEASYVYTHTKSKPSGRLLTEIVLGVPDVGKAQQACSQAIASVLGIEMAKEWANRPANHCTPTQLAGAAKSLAKFKRVKCEVLGLKDILKLGMGSFAAVAKGSSQAPQFVVLQYAGAAKSQAPTVLVGKGITFDSGGISIKPSPEMDEMKFDMCGAASVLGVFRALAELQPAINVVGLIATCENLPGPDALKPSDVITAMDGQTIEVLNTDAEGRLILCDALVYAKRFAPAAIVDIATLTGACVIALGAVRSGLFANDERLAKALLDAGDASLDLCWRMPLDDEYSLGLKSNFADVANVGGRAGGAVTAAKFLQRFVKDVPWAHLDIAGTAWKSGGEKGATGRPVSLLLTYLLGQSGTETVGRPLATGSARASSKRGLTKSVAAKP